MNPMPQLAPLLKQLRLSGILDSLEVRNRQAIEEKLAYTDFLAMLIQDGARRNIENVERSVSSIEEATALAKSSGNALNEIVEMVLQSSDQVRSIATASEQQSATSEEINRSVEEVSAISSETSLAMNQAAQAVSDLATQTQELRLLIEEMSRAERKCTGWPEQKCTTRCQRKGPEGPFLSI